ncbi:hypothetical protein [Tardiphaga sp.]|jgi:hypothetical protein|uniref:hypothetical protein n=1 Tax=Tardiphaga sp. TaxID=1926292 RepID=UPI0037DA1FA7
MDSEPRQWTGIGWVLVAGCLALAICCGLSATLAQNNRMTPRPVRADMTTVVPRACLSEFYAYLKVADTARELGSDRDILDFALDRLHTGLVACLTDDDTPEPASEAALVDGQRHRIVASHAQPFAA